MISSAAAAGGTDQRPSSRRGASRGRRNFIDASVAKSRLNGNNIYELMHVLQTPCSSRGMRRDASHDAAPPRVPLNVRCPLRGRSEEHTSELQSLMRISYAVFCLTKKKNKSYKIMLM